MSQMIEQFESDAIKLLRFNKPQLLWSIAFANEGAIDLGSLAPDLFTDICVEIIHPHLKLFVKSPNLAANHDRICNLLIPNPEVFPAGSLREKNVF